MSSSPSIATPFELAQWEHSKENVQPRKRGRNPASLARRFGFETNKEDLALQVSERRK